MMMREKEVMALFLYRGGGCVACPLVVRMAKREAKKKQAGRTILLNLLPNLSF